MEQNYLFFYALLVCNIYEFKIHDAPVIWNSLFNK
jgi:hypothetical protein